MVTHASYDAVQPTCMGKSKTESNNSADSRGSGAGKNRRITKPTPSAHRGDEVVDWNSISEAVRREEARRAALKKSLGPAPKRGDVKAAIFKDVVDATWGFLCASPTFTADADAFLDSVPFPKMSQPMAYLWPLVQE